MIAIFYTAGVDKAMITIYNLTDRQADRQTG